MKNPCASNCFCRLRHVFVLRGRGGYSLIELMITVAATAILFAAIAVPALNVLRDSKLSGCNNNKEVIEAAKTSWCADNPAKYQLIKEGSTDPSLTPTIDEILSYLPGQALPICPSHGTYSNITTIGTRPTCDATGH